MVTRSTFRFGSGTHMTEESIVSVLKPAMKIAQVPQWPSARWVGGLDLPAKLAPSIELLDSSGYCRARLLVRHRGRPVTFVDVDVVDHMVDGVRLGEMVSQWNLGHPSDIATLSTDDLPFITVVMCTRNRAIALEDALASVLACDYPRFEVIVVDNASADDSTVEIRHRAPRSAGASADRARPWLVLCA